MGGGGGIKNSQGQLQGIAGQQQTNASNFGAQGQTLINEGQTQQTPLVDFLHKLISGDSTTTSQALAPVVGNITAGTNANREHIFDSTAPGAGRDLLLGQNQLNQGTQVAQATNQTFLQAFPELAQLASGNTQAGLALTGAGVTSLGNAGTTTGSVLNSQEQQKASTLNLFGQLAGAAGGLVAPIKLCWVAEAVYGIDDRRTHLVRAYLNGPFRKTILGSLVVELYISIGRQVAWVARRSALTRRMLKPLFDRAVAAAENK